MNSDPQRPQQQQHIEGEGFIGFLAWFEDNKKGVLIGAVALLVVGFGIYIYNYTSEQKEAAASAALIALHPSVNGSTNEPPVPASAFLKIAEEHRGTAAAERAILLAAGANFTEGKYADAQTQFDRLLKENPSSKWAADAAYGVAASLESQGKRDEALTAYQRVVTAYPSSAVVGEARLALARVYEAKSQPAEALKQYDDLTRGGMISMRAQDAMMRRSQLLKKHPELDKPATNAIPAMAPINLPSATNKSQALTTATTNMAPMTNKAGSAKTNPAAAPKP
jgi:TolA-binding protein